MNLSEAIAATYLGHNEQAGHDRRAAGMIYDIRQTTTYEYASIVSHARAIVSGCCRR